METSRSQGEWLTVKEAAAYVGLAKATIYSLASKRRIPFCKRSKRLYFRRSELRSWIEESRKDTIEQIEQRLRKTGKL